MSTHEESLAALEALGEPLRKFERELLAASESIEDVFNRFWNQRREKLMNKDVPRRPVKPKPPPTPVPATQQSEDLNQLLARLDRIIELLERLPYTPLGGGPR